MNRRFRSIVPFFSLLLINGARAQQGSYGATTTPDNTVQNQQTIIVTGTYRPIPLDNSDRSIQVVDFSSSPELYNSWADGLRLDASVDLRQRAPGTQADLSIRGSSFGQTLVLVNGLRVNDAQSGHHNLDLPIPFASIEKLEILQGSGSTMYGSDAVGGAVNFITDAPRTELVVGAGGGNYGTNEQYGSIAYWHKGVSEQLSLTREFSTGFMPDRDYRNMALASESRIATGLGTTSLLLGLSDRPFGAGQFYGNFNSWERTKGWFVGASQDLGDNTEIAFGYRRHTDEFVLLRDQPSVYANNHITKSYQLSIRRHDRLAQSMNLFYGIEAYRDSIASNILGSHLRNQGALYLDATFARSRLSFSTGARLETHTGGNTQVSPQLSSGYRLSNQLKVKGSVSHAFRLPTFTDLYYQDPVNLGNPNLKPERAWGYELGLVWKPSRHVSLEATVFNRRERDGIDYVRSSSDRPWQAANINRLNFRGVEIMTAMVHRQQRFELGYTAIYAEVEGPTDGMISKYMRNYPEHQATAEWLGSLTRMVQFRTRIGITDRYQRGPYPLAEVATVGHLGHLAPFLKISNISNTGYEEIEGVRMPGRSYVAGLELRLKLKSSQH